MSADPAGWTQNAQAGAMAYVLHALLQEAERKNSGFIGRLIEAAVDDHKGIPADVPDKPFVDAVFAETLQMLRRAQASPELPELPPAPRPRDVVVETGEPMPPRHGRQY